MKKNEQKLANIGCLSVFILLAVAFILIPKSKNENRFQFETVSSYDAGKNAKVLCIYTNCTDFDIIKKHAFTEGKKTENSIVIFYYQKRSKIPDISKSGFVIDDKDHKNAVATYKKYGKNIGEFLIH